MTPMARSSLYPIQEHRASFVVLPSFLAPLGLNSLLDSPRKHASCQGLHWISCL